MAQPTDFPILDPGPTDLVLVRTLPARAANVWRCWTEPALVKQFFAPAPGRVPEAQVEPWPGGIFHVVMEFDDHGRMEGAPGCVLVAEPGRRFAWTDALGPGFRPGAEPGFFAADITFADTEAGCEYRVIARHATQEAAESHEAMGFSGGWGMVAEQLGRLAATL